MNIGPTGKISACGGNGGNGVTRTKSGSGGAVGSKTGLSGGGGAGGGGIIAIVYAGTIVKGAPSLLVAESVVPSLITQATRTKPLRVLTAQLALC